MLLVINIIFNAIFILLLGIIVYLLYSDYGYIISISKERLKWRQYTRNIIYDKNNIKIEKYSKSMREVISKKSLHHSPHASIILKSEQNNTIFNSVICWCLKYPGNGGEILRTAYNLGFKKIIFVSNDPLPNKFWRTIESRSMGTFALIDKYNPTVSEFVFNIKEINICIETGPKSEYIYTYNFKDIIYNKKINLVIGSEFSGIPTNILNKSEYIFNLGENSFNVCASFSIACGVFMSKFNKI